RRGILAQRSPFEPSNWWIHKAGRNTGELASPAAERSRLCVAEADLGLAPHRPLAPAASQAEPAFGVSLRMDGRVIAEKEAIDCRCAALRRLGEERYSIT